MDANATLTLTATAATSESTYDCLDLVVERGAAHLTLAGPGFTVHRLVSGHLLLGRRLTIPTAEYQSPDASGRAHAEVSVEDACRVLALLHGLGGWRHTSSSPGLRDAWDEGGGEFETGDFAEPPFATMPPPPSAPASPAPAPAGPTESAPGSQPADGEGGVR